MTDQKDEDVINNFIHDLNRDYLLNKLVWSEEWLRLELIRKTIEWRDQNPSPKVQELVRALEDARGQLEMFNFAKDEIRVRNADDILFKALANFRKEG